MGGIFVTDFEKIEILAEAMDVDVEDLNETDDLTQKTEWDSLAVLSFMANVAAKCGKKLKPQEVQDVVTVRDALNLIP